MPDPGATESVGTNRRRWFKVALVAGGTVVTAAAGRAALGIKFSENNQQQPQAEGTLEFSVPPTARPVTIGQLLTESSDPQVAEAARRTAQEVYARGNTEPEDWAIIVTKPRPGTALSFILNGIELTEAAKSKKGTTPGMEIIIQRKDETDPTQILEDNQHPQADLVGRVNGTGEIFYSISPGYEPDQYGWKGFGLVTMADGQKRPPITVMGETADSLVLYMPITSFRDAKYPQSITNFTAASIPVTYPNR